MLLSFANQKNIDFVDPRGTGAERHFKRSLQPTPSNPASAPEHIYIHVPICLHCLPLPTFPTLSWFSEVSNTVLQLENRADRENGFVKVLKTNLITKYTSPSAALLCQNFDRPQYGIERKGLKFNIQISELVSLGRKWLGFKGRQGTRIVQFFGKWELAELIQNSWWRVWTNQVA